MEQMLTQHRFAMYNRGYATIADSPRKEVPALNDHEVSPLRGAEVSNLHPTLLSRLSRDEAASAASLAQDDLPTATATVKSTSDRRLLHMTSKALSTVDNLMDCTDPKVRLAAASKALDISPATRPAALQQQEAAIPVAAFTALLEGLGSLFQSARSAPVHPMADNPDASLRDATEVPFTKES